MVISDSNFLASRGFEVGSARLIFLLLVGLVEEHPVLRPRQPLEPRRDGQVDDGDPEDHDQDPDPVCDHSSGRPIGVVLAVVVMKKMGLWTIVGQY